jgi:cytochrome c-type biogenesis protein CcmE
MSAMPRKRLQLLMGAVIILSGLGGLIVYSFNQNLVYDHSVAEYLADPSLKASNCRIYGKVQPDSIVRNPDGIGVAFSVTDGRQSVPVRYGREVPDTFKEDGDVVVEGTLDAQGVFQAHQLLAKCPSKYEAEGVEHPAGEGYGTTGS